MAYIFSIDICIIEPYGSMFTLNQNNKKGLILHEDDDYHQFSDEDLKEFASELGLDSYLEDKRNTYKLEP